MNALIGAAGIGALFLLALELLAIHTVGLGALGGPVGASLADEY